MAKPAMGPAAATSNRALRWGMIPRIRITAPKVAPRAGPEVLEKLKALGYAE